MIQVLPAYTSDAALLEDLDMTFQIALVGNDGVVVASDRLFVERGLAGHLATLRHSFQRQTATKIHESHDKKVVCAYAGGPYAETIARRIVTGCNPAQLSDVEWRNRLELAIKEVNDYADNTVDEILVCRTDQLSVLKITRQRNEDPGFMAITEFACSGVDSHARVLPKISWGVDMDLAQLSHLAAVTIAHAHEEFPSLVGGGADILTIDKMGHIEKKQFTQEEIDRTRIDFSRKIREVIFQ